MFVGKAEAYLTEIPFRCSPDGKANGHTRKHNTRLEKDKLSNNYKNSCLLAVKSFITLAPVLTLHVKGSLLIMTHIKLR